MPSSGDLTVRYTIISTKAESALKRISAKLKAVEQHAIKSGKQIAKAMKASAAVFAAFGAIAVGVLYSIVRGSSFASMWVDQFNMTMKKLYDYILEVTGLGDAIDAFLIKFKAFVDVLTDEGLQKWIDDLSTFDTILLAVVVTLGIITAALAFAIAVGLGLLGVSAAVTGAIAGFTALAAAIATIPIWIAVIIGAVIAMIVIWVLWKTGILDAITDLGAKFGTWVKDLGARFATWVAGLGEKFATFVTNTKEKLSKFKTWMIDKFQAAWDGIIDGLKIMKDTAFGILNTLMDKISGIIKAALSIPSKIAEKAGGVYESATSRTRTSGFASGGQVIRSGAAVVHSGESIVQLKSLLSGIRTDQTSVNGSKSVVNNVTVNISSSMSDPFEIDKVVDTVSRKLTAELGRISTSI